MKVLVLGSGGREHALVRALKQGESNNEVHVTPGNDGMRGEAVVHGVSLQDLAGLANLYAKLNFDLVVVGPDQALADGVSDFFRGLGAKVFGPSREAARLEWSKSYAKDFMAAAQLPTARFEIVKSVEDVEHGMERFNPPWVIKADGLAFGKGVYICASAEELGIAAKEIFVEKKFGDAGLVAIMEEFKPGWEISVHVVTDGENFEIFPFAQDHKRLGEGNQGPNTGGMGTVAPIPVDAVLVEKIRRLVVEPSIAEIKKRKMLYRGILFIGLMICDGEPIVLEFNSRFGDPEAQVFMPLLDGDWGEVFKSVAEGRCPAMKWKNLCAVCVVMAAEGYPENPNKGVVIKGSLQSSSEKKYFLHAGTKASGTSFVTHGGRVLNAIGLGASVAEAQANAYELSTQVTGLVVRKDIASQFAKPVQA